MAPRFAVERTDRRRMAAVRRGMHVLERRTFEAEIPAPMQPASRWAVSLIE